MGESLRGPKERRKEGQVGVGGRGRGALMVVVLLLGRRTAVVVVVLVEEKEEDDEEGRMVVVVIEDRDAEGEERVLPPSLSLSFSADVLVCCSRAAIKLRMGCFL